MSDAEVRRKDLREERRQAILEAALRLFAERGYHETKMDDVAEKAGLSKGAIYLYYQNKEDLFFSLLSQKMDQAVPAVEKALKQSRSLTELVRNVVATLLELREKNKDFYRIFYSEQPRFDLGSRRGVEILIEKFDDLITRLGRAFELFMPEADGQGGARDLAICLLGMLNAHTIDWMVTHDPRPLVARTDLIARVFLRGVLPNGNG